MCWKNTMPLGGVWSKGLSKAPLSKGQRHSKHRFLLTSVVSYSSVRGHPLPSLVYWSP